MTNASEPRPQILVPALQRGDAVGDHTLELADALAAHYGPIDILFNYPLAATVSHPLHNIRMADDGDVDGETRLTVVQYPLWFPLADRVRLVQGPKLFWYHGVTPPRLWGSRNDVEILRESEFKTALAWHTHLAVTASPFTRDELHRHSGYPLERIRVVPLGIDVERFAAPVDPDLLDELRGSWQLHGRHVLLYVGRVAGHKRIDLLIDAVAELVDQHPQVKLLIVGDAEANRAAQELQEHLRGQIARLDLENHVTITGRVPAIEPFLQLADLFVLPSMHEGFGAPLVEAMAAGVPVLAGESGAMPWVVNGAGTLFQAGDVADLAAQISRILRSAPLRQSMAEAGRKRASDFSLANFAERSLQVCTEATALALEPTPFEQVIGHSVYSFADVRLAAYEVRSNAPLVGKLIAWIRRNSTSHVKEAYLDPILERQVRYNQYLATEIEQLRVEIYRLREGNRDAG